MGKLAGKFPFTGTYKPIKFEQPSVGPSSVPIKHESAEAYHVNMDSYPQGPHYGSRHANHQGKDFFSSRAGKLPTGLIQGGSCNPTVVHGSVVSSTQTTQVSISHAMSIVHSHTEGNYPSGLPISTTQVNYPPQPSGGMPTAALPNHL